jgi:hypothetical protein
MFLVFFSVFARPRSLLSTKNFKIRRIIEYPDTEEEGGGRERIGYRTGSLGLSLDFVKE